MNFLAGILFLVQAISGVHTYAFMNGLPRLRVWWYTGVTRTLVNEYTFGLVLPILLPVKLVQKLRRVFSELKRLPALRNSLRLKRRFGI